MTILGGGLRSTECSLISTVAPSAHANQSPLPRLYIAAGRESRSCRHAITLTLTLSFKWNSAKWTSVTLHVKWLKCTLHFEVHCVSKKSHALCLRLYLWHISTDFHNFWQTCTARKLQQGNNKPLFTVCVTALPCKILITTLVMFASVLVHSKCKIVILELVHASKWNSTTTQLQKMFDMSSY